MTRTCDFCAAQVADSSDRCPRCLNPAIGPSPSTEAYVDLSKGRSPAAGVSLSKHQQSVPAADRPRIPEAPAPASAFPFSNFHEPVVTPVGHRGRSITYLAASVAALATCAVAAWVAVWLVDSGSNSTGANANSAGSEPSDASLTPSPPPVESSLGSTTPRVKRLSPREREVPNVQCWDGTAAAALIACRQPEGRDGMVWVFPSMKFQSCSKGSPGPSVIQRWACADTLSISGTPVRIEYTQWRSETTAQAELLSQLGTPIERRNPVGDVALLEYAAELDGQSTMVKLDVRQPWSASASVPTYADSASAFGDVVQIRPGIQFGRERDE